jgi:hypothetical protein
MNKLHSYTDEDIQAYAAGYFTGDTAEFKKQMDADRSLREEVDLYRYLFTGIQQQEEMQLSFDLPEAVLQKLPTLKQKQSKLPVTWFFAIITALIVWICLPVLSPYLSSVTVETTALAGCVLLIFIVVFHYAEYKRKYRLYAGLL